MIYTTMTKKGNAYCIRCTQRSGGQIWHTLYISPSSNALTFLTHKDDVDYLDYVRNIKLSSDPYAKTVKLADLRHNSNLYRFNQIDEKALFRVKKMLKPLRF